jgi:hypothetical protein
MAVVRELRDDMANEEPAAIMTVGAATDAARAGARAPGKGRSVSRRRDAALRADRGRGPARRAVAPGSSATFFEPLDRNAERPGPTATGGTFCLARGVGIPM